MNAHPTAPVRLLADDDYRSVAEAYRTFLRAPVAIEAHLCGVIADTLSHPGSLVRAQIAFGIMIRHGVARETALRVAVALEYFHTASLLFDDLPCMDNANERRGHACPHAVWGESAAILGALALVNRGYALLWEAIGTLPEVRRDAAAKLVESSLGLEGILNGQSLDLHFNPLTADETDVTRVADGKTVTLIRLTLRLPAIVAGLPDEVQERLEALSRSWGQSYQIMDDFKDCLLGREETGKTGTRDQALRRPNLPLMIGHERAMSRLVAIMASARACLQSLVKIGGRGWLQLEALHAKLEAELRTLQLRLPAPAAL